MKDKELRKVLEKAGLIDIWTDGRLQTNHAKYNHDGLVAEVGYEKERLDDLFSTVVRLMNHLGLVEEEIPAKPKKTIIVKNK